MLQLILIIFIILIIIAIICMDFNNVENFKDKVDKTDNISINVLIDVTIKILTIKSILDETLAKLNYDIIMLHELKSNNQQIEILNDKIIEIEKYRDSIDSKMQKIDKMKDKVYSKLPKILVEKLDRSVELTLERKTIYKEIIELTSNNKFNKINPELLKLEKYSKDLQTILLDIMTKFY